MKLIDARNLAMRFPNTLRRILNENTVPTIFGHGDIDDVVPYKNSLDLKAKLDEYGVENTFISFPNTNHECDDKESMSKIMQLFFESIDKYLK